MPEPHGAGLIAIGLGVAALLKRYATYLPFISLVTRIGDDTERRKRESIYLRWLPVIEALIVVGIAYGRMDTRLDSAEKSIINANLMSANALLQQQHVMENMQTDIREMRTLMLRRPNQDGGG